LEVRREVSKLNRKLSVFVFLVGLFLFSFFVGGEKDAFHASGDGSALDVYFFYGQGCPHCANVEPCLAEIERQYPLRLHRFDIYSNRSCVSVFDDYSERYGLPLEQRGVPSVFVSDTYLVGDGPILEGFEEAVKKALSERPTVDQASGVKALEISDQEVASVASGGLSVFTVTVAALVDSVSPCSIAILVFLIGARVLVPNRGKRALKVGLAYCLSVFIAYFLFGLGLLTIVQVSGLSAVFSLLVGFVAFLAGIFYVKDVFWYGRGGFVMEVPSSLKPLLMRMLKGVTSPFGAFAMGFVASCFELPCTGGPYLFILGLLADSATRLQAIPLLLYYNFLFVLPLVIISLVLYSNLFSIGRVREWSEKNGRLLRLVGGFVVMALGFSVIPVSQTLQFVQLFLRFFRVIGLPVLAVVFLSLFVSFEGLRNFESRLMRLPWCGALLLSLLISPVFIAQDLSIGASSFAALQESSVTQIADPWMLDLTILWGSPMCPGRNMLVNIGTKGVVVNPYAPPPHTEFYVALYGKYKKENNLAWRPLGTEQFGMIMWRCGEEEFTCVVQSGVLLEFKLPKLPEVEKYTEEESIFQLWALGRGCLGSCGPPELQEGRPVHAERQAKKDINVLKIVKIRIEGKQDKDDPVTTEEVTYTAELSKIYDWKGATVTFEVKPTGTRTTSCGGGAIGAWEGKGQQKQSWEWEWKETHPGDTHGEKKVTVKVKWDKHNCILEEEEDYNLFFKKKKRDHDNINWFNYWSGHDDKAVVTRGFSHTSPNFIYGGRGEGPGDYGETDPATGVIKIFDAASEAIAFTICGQSYSFTGIDTLAFVIGHERAHADTVDNWKKGGSWYGKADSDCDAIPDEVEDSLTAGGCYFDKEFVDSTSGRFGWSSRRSLNPWGYDGMEGGGDDGKCAIFLSVDQERYADIMGLSAMGSSRNSNNDWAKPGKQSSEHYKRLIVENGTSAEFTGKFAEYGKDTDGNGLFNYLTVEAEINVTSAGTYSLRGLLSKNQNVFSTGNSTFYFGVGLHNFTLDFDGIEFRKRRIDGPYNLEEVTLFRSTNGSDSRTNALNTSAYSYKQFEQPKAEIVGKFSESAIDTNGNSLYDRLDISLAVNITKAGNYTVIAVLNKERNLISSTNSSFLNIGEQNITLSFDGLELRSYRVNGPYSLKVIEILDQDYNQTDFVQDVYNTSAYLYTQFEKPRAEFTGKFSDLGVDTDGDGLFDVLRIKAEVSAEAGSYTFSADLSDVNDTKITSNYTDVALTSGVQNVTLDLDGTPIGDHGVDGPYLLTFLTLYNSDGSLLSMEVDRHNTSAYTHSQFERSGKIIGRVLAYNGTAIENAFVDILSDTIFDYTLTDSNGNYSLSGLETGTYNLSVTPPDPNLSLNSTKYPISLTKGQTAVVDFVLSQAGSISGYVLHPNGTTLSNITVYWEDLESPSFETDENGSYLMPYLDPGTYVLRAVAPPGTGVVDAIKTVTVTLGQTTYANLTLQIPGNIHGTVTDSVGNPVGDVYVSTSGRSMGTNITDANGYYEINTLIPGTYVVSAFPLQDSLAGNSTTVEVNEGETTTANVILPVGGIITGTITDYLGTPVWDADVWAVIGSEYRHSYTDFYGNYEIRGLRNGTYTVYASAPADLNLLPNSTIANVSLEEVTVVDITLPKGGIITGFVTDTNGNPVYGAEVKASGPSRGSNYTDTDGSYTILALRTGSYTITATPLYSVGLLPNTTSAYVVQGEVTVANITLPSDTTLPIIDINYPTEGARLNVPSLWVNGTVTELNMGDLEPTIDDTRFDIAFWIPIIGEFAFRNNTNIPDGPVSLTVSYEDLARNVGSATVTFTVDTVPPTVQVTFPNGGEILGIGTNYTITWEASDLNPLTYSVAYTRDGGINWIPLALDLRENSYVWNTSQLQSGSSYLVKVTANDGINTGEDISNSMFTATIQGDINGDLIVNLLDIFALGKAYGSIHTSPNWNPNADINNDLVINALDLDILNKNYGKKTP